MVDHIHVAAGGTAPILDVQGITVSYGKTVAVRQASLAVREGEIVALVGANGAGKSSVLKSILGVGGSLEGRIVYQGNDLVGRAPEDRVDAGIALVPEGRHVFPQLSVAENLELGFKRGGKADMATRLARMFELFPILKDRVAQAAGTLSGGEQQMLVIGRALMSAPRVLMLDEPTLGLAPKIVARLGELLQLLRAEGQTILLAEQNARMSLGVSDRAYVLAQGSVIREGASSDLLGSDDIRRAYLGL